MLMLKVTYLVFSLMIDSIVSQHIIPIPKPVKECVSEPFRWKRIWFHPLFEQNTRNIKGYKAEFHNLFLLLSGDRLIIKNSWHKFFHGNNYSDYTMSHIEETASMLRDKFTADLFNGQVTKIAYGCVIEADPEQNYPYWIAMKNKKPLPMIKGKQYGAFFNFSDFKFKGYNKSFEVLKHDRETIPKHLFRVECEVKYMRHLHKRKSPVPVNSVKDLYNFDVLQLLADDLLCKYKTIDIMYPMNFEEMTLAEKKILAIMRDHELRTDLRKNHNKTFKRYNIQVKEMKVKYATSTYYRAIEDNMCEKMGQLLVG